MREKDIEIDFFFQIRIDFLSVSNQTDLFLSLLSFRLDSYFNERISKHNSGGGEKEKEGAELVESKIVF